MISGTLETLLLAPLMALTIIAAAPEDQPEAASRPDLPELISRLADSERELMRFEETRPSTLLAEPLTVTGSLQRDGDHLIRETESPRRETQTLSESHFEVRRPGGFRQRFSLSRAPELAVLRQALLALLDGNPDQLEQHFSQALSWEGEAWTVALIPRDTDMAERVDKLLLSGHDDRLKSLTLLLSDGDSIQTRFLDQP